MDSRIHGPPSCRAFTPSSFSLLSRSVGFVSLFFCHRPQGRRSTGARRPFFRRSPFSSFATKNERASASLDVFFLGARAARSASRYFFFWGIFPFPFFLRAAGKSTGSFLLQRAKEDRGLAEDLGSLFCHSVLSLFLFFFGQPRRAMAGRAPANSSLFPRRLPSGRGGLLFFSGA